MTNILARFFSIFASMKDLEQIIEKCLLVKGRVILPHWGILTIHRTSASMDKNGGWMYPPVEDISFIEVPQLGSEELESELSQFVFSQPVDVAQLASQIADFASVKKEEGTWSLGRLGQFEVDAQQISWDSAPASNWSLLADLPDIRLPHPRFSESAKQQTQAAASSVGATPDVDPSLSENEEDTSSSRSLFIVLILVLILALVMVIGSLMYWGPLTSSSTTKADYPMQKERMNVHPEELSSAVKRTSDTQSMGEENTPFELEHRVPVVESSLSDAKPNPTESASEELPKETKADSDESEVKENTDCVIIVGAFSNQRNVQQMKERLTDRGYHLYSASSGNLTRVGVQAPCPASEILEELRTIRREIEPSAWILNE